MAAVVAAAVAGVPRILALRGRRAQLRRSCHSHTLPLVLRRRRALPALCSSMFISRRRRELPALRSSMFIIPRESQRPPRKPSSHNNLG